MTLTTITVDDLRYLIEAGFDPSQHPRSHGGQFARKGTGATDITAKDLPAPASPAAPHPTDITVKDLPSKDKPEAPPKDKPKPRYYTRDEVEYNLLTDPKWLERGILALWKRANAQGGYQLPDRSFDRAHDRLLSSFAQQVRDGKRLSPKQLEIGRSIIHRYSGILTRMANNKAES